MVDKYICVSLYQIINIMTVEMRTLKEITKSLIESYNNNERPNFIDIRDLELLSQQENK